MENEALHKLSFSFTSEDIGILESIKAQLRPLQGKVSNIVALRYALRRAAKDGNQG